MPFRAPTRSPPHAALIDNQATVTFHETLDQETSHAREVHVILKHFKAIPRKIKRKRSNES
jgi:hypothetical protein